MIIGMWNSLMTNMWVAGILVMLINPLHSFYPVAPETLKVLKKVCRKKKNEFLEFFTMFLCSKMLLRILVPGIAITKGCMLCSVSAVFTFGAIFPLQ